MKLRLSILALLLSCLATAQNPYIALEGAAAASGELALSQPRTLVGVDVTVACDRIISGPYARYAQKYLGVRAPLTDKCAWSVERASVSLLDAATAWAAQPVAAPATEAVSHSEAMTEFVRIQADKVDMSAPTLEDAARKAAETIFSLRRHRLELITGEAGENVFGEGLKAALDEIARLEQSYLELFLGKHIVSTLTRRYVVQPEAGKQQYIVCRFHADAGLLPESDLSGDMILLQTEPSAPSTAGLEADPKLRDAVGCRIAAPTTCTVILGGHEYARAVVPVFEFGRSIRVPLYNAGH